MSALSGFWVALAVWCVLARGGRRARLGGGLGCGIGSDGVGVPGSSDGAFLNGVGSPMGPHGVQQGRVPGSSGPFGARPWLPWRSAPEDRGELVLLVVAQVGALLRAGAAPAEAWARAVGVGADAVGVPDEGQLASHVGGRDTARAVVAACRLAADVGAPLVTVLDRIARSVAAEAEATADRDAALEGPRTTMRVLLWLPLAGVLLGVVLGADPVGTALSGGVGTLGLLLGGGLLLVGRTWSARLVARARAAGEGR